MPDTAASQDCICGHEWEAHYGGGCDYEGCGCRRYPIPDTAASTATVAVTLTFPPGVIVDVRSFVQEVLDGALPDECAARVVSDAT